MRETRLSGSEGGVAHCAIPTPIVEQKSKSAVSRVSKVSVTLDA
jgi:hypothetical protein